MTFAEASVAVDQWFAERIACGAIAQHTPAYNQAFEAKADLKARLGKVLGALDPFPPLPAPAPQAPPQAPPPVDSQPAADAAPEQE